MYSPSNRYLVSSRISGLLDEELREYVRNKKTDTSQLIRDLLERELDGWRQREGVSDSINKDLMDMVKQSERRATIKESLIKSADTYSYNPDYFLEQCEKYGFSLEEILAISESKSKRFSLTGISACEYFIMGRLSISKEERSTTLKDACAKAGFSRSDIDRAFERRTTTSKKGDAWYKTLIDTETK